MKIIGHINDASLIVEMTREELANLNGIYTERDMCGRCGERWSNAFDIGREYPVNGIFKRLKLQSSASGQLDGAATSLRALADLLETIKPATELIAADPQPQQ